MSERKPAAFSPEENRAMRFVLRDLKDRNKWTQAEVGRRLGGLTQQAASTILNRNGNFSRQSALHLARMCGFDSPESMLADLGTTTKTPADGQWLNRDIAAGYARRLNCESEAIDRVIRRYGDQRFMTRDAKWWVERFIHEDRELGEERGPSTPPAPESSVPAPKARPKRAG